MLSEQMLTGLNDQITKEFASSYLYLQMAAWFENNSLNGFASWMKVQAQEEAAHMEILFNYVNERGGYVQLGEVPRPASDYESPLDIMKKTLAHEQKVTASINNLMSLAISENDFASKARLDWFVSEQVEEEATASDLVAKLAMIGDQSSALFMMDKELGTRVFTPPSPLAKG